MNSTLCPGSGKPVKQNTTNKKEWMCSSCLLTFNKLKDDEPPPTAADHYAYLPW